MELFLLGGNSRKNLEWVKLVETRIKDLFSSTTVLIYEHWLSGQSTIDLNTESKKLANLIDVRKDFMIFAKSAGILTVLKAIKDYNLRPKACVFCGFPLSWARVHSMPVLDFLQSYSVSTTFIQNDHDPFCSAEELEKILQTTNVQKYNFIKTSGDTHDYEDYELLREVFGKLLDSFPNTQ